MPVTQANIDAVLKELSAKKAAQVKAATVKAAEDEGGKDTAHPSKAVDNGTTASNLEGARAAENSTDLKKQQPVGTETAGAPATTQAAGSQGVAAKGPDQKPENKPDTSGVSEMANKDTSHPSAKSAAERAIELLTLAIKQANPNGPAAPKAEEKQANDKAEAEKVAAEKVAADKVAAEFKTFCGKVVQDFPQEFSEGFKFAAEVMDLIKQAQAEVNRDKIAAVLKKAGIDPAMLAGAAPAGAPAPMGDPAAAMDPAAGGVPEGGGAPEGGGDDIVNAIAQALAEQGVSAEDLAQGLSSGEGVGGSGPEEELAALQAALQAEGTTPEQLAEMVAAQEGGGAPAGIEGGGATGGEMAVDEAAKAAAEKQEKIAALTTTFRTKIQALKTAAKKG